MEIVPSTTIYLLKGIDIDPDYRNTLYFSSVEQQNDYFLDPQKVVKSFNNTQYQRANRGWLRIRAGQEEILEANYMAFNNNITNHGKWYYAFILQKNYVNPEVTEIEYQIDVIQSWWNQWTCQPCFVEREHSVTDVAGENIVPEPVELGDMICEKLAAYDFTDLDALSIVMAATFKVGSEPTPPTPPEPTPTGWAEYWVGDDSEGNPFDVRYGMPHAATYTWGRMWEYQGQLPYGLGDNGQGTSRVGDWYAITNTFEKGTEPRQGSVLVLAGGPDGLGHVCFVESVDPIDLSIVTSNSKAQYPTPPIPSQGATDTSPYFYLSTRLPDNNYIAEDELNQGYVFQGFIYPNANSGIEIRTSFWSPAPMYRSAGFVPRLTADGVYNSQYWYSSTNPLYPDWRLPNCVCYAWGRAWEITGKVPTLPPWTASSWWGTLDRTKYATTQEPELGAIACWDEPDDPEGPGHLAVVERIDPDGTVWMSESRWVPRDEIPTYPPDHPKFWAFTRLNNDTKRLTWMYSGYRLQGYIRIYDGSSQGSGNTGSSGNGGRAATNITDFNGGRYNGVFSGLYYNVYDNTDSGASALKADIASAVAAGKTEGIVGLFLAPSKMFQATPDSIAPELTKHFPKFTGVTRKDGSTVKNQKLLTAPYNLLTVRDGTGNEKDYAYEFFLGSDCGFTFHGDVTPTSGVLCIPQYYNGEGRYSLEEYMVLTGYPMLPYNTSAFSEFMAQWPSMAISIGASAIKGGIAGAVGGGGLKGGLAGATLSGVSAAVGYVGEGVTARRRGNVAHGAPGMATLVAQCSSVDGEGTRPVLRFQFVPRHVRPEFATIIDDFFTMFGYATNKVKKPNISSRPSFNYVKTNGAIIVGGASGYMSAEDLRVVASAFDKGITFWKPGVKIGNYSAPNSP